MSLAEWLGPGLHKAVGQYIEEELGAEEPGDVRHLQPEHIEAIKSQLKPLQIPKFQEKYDALLGGGSPSSAGAAAAEIWLEEVGRFTNAEMKSTCDTLEERECARVEQLVYHYTDIESAKLIIAEGNPGFRASTVGQGGGGFYVVTNGPHEMNWDQYQGGEFRGTVGAALWGEKAADVAVGGKDAHKLDVVFLIKIPTDFIKGAKGVPGRESIKIVPPQFLMEKGAHHYLQKEHIVKGYILKKPQDDLGAVPAGPAPMPQGVDASVSGLFSRFIRSRKRIRA